MAVTIIKVLSPRSRLSKFRLPSWAAEYAEFAAIGTTWAACATILEFALQRVFDYGSGFKTRVAILWFLWGVQLGPFYSYAMRPIAQDVLRWRKFDAPDPPPIVTSGSLLKANLLLLPSGATLFDISRWLPVAWSTSHNIFWGWPLYVLWLGFLYEYAGINGVGAPVFTFIIKEDGYGPLYMVIMFLQMWYASAFGANLSTPFCAPTWLFSSWIYRRCSRTPSFWTAMISLIIAVLGFHLMPLINYWFWDLMPAPPEASHEHPSKCDHTEFEDYQYRPLKVGEIRVLAIERQKNVREVVNTRLLHVPIDKAKYDSISYTWDYPPKFEYLIVDGKKLKITSKAYRIIEDRKSKFQDEVIWIDSVCINQQDKLERSEQVGMMCEIYRTARRTIIWLDPMEDAYAAFSLVESVASRVFKWIPEPYDYVLFIRRFLQVLIMEHDIRQRALSDLFQQKYFLRTWIVQEIIFSKIVHIRCSGHWLSWDKLETAMLTVHDQKYHGLLASKEMMRSFQQVGVLQEIGWLCEVRKSFHKPAGFEPLKLSHVLSRFSYFRVTDPRDRIFGLLNLTDGKGAPELVPDYDVDAAEVFRRTASYLLRVGELDEILYAAGIGYGKRIDNLPSWLPDWTSPPTSERLRIDKSFKVYQASGSTSPSICFLDRNALAVTGSAFDKLATVTRGTFTSLDPSGNNVYNLEQAITEQLLLDVEIQSLLNMSSTDAATGQSNQEALRRTLIGDTLRDLAHPFARPADLSKWESVITAWEYSVNIIKDDPATASRLRKGLSKNNQRLLREEFRRLVSSFPDHVIKGWSDGIKYFTIARTCTAGKKFAITRKGYMALVPPLSKKGDAVCVLYGLEVPFILRKSTRKPRDQYEIVGESYVHGLMDGEALRNGAEETTFQIR